MSRTAKRHGRERAAYKEWVKCLSSKGGPRERPISAVRSDRRRDRRAAEERVFFLRWARPSASADRYSRAGISSRPTAPADRSTVRAIVRWFDPVGRPSPALNSAVEPARIARSPAAKVPPAGSTAAPARARRQSRAKQNRSWRAVSCVENEQHAVRFQNSASAVAGLTEPAVRVRRIAHGPMCGFRGYVIMRAARSLGPARPHPPPAA